MNYESYLTKEFKEKIESNQIKKEKNGKYRFTKVIDGTRYSCNCDTPEQAAVKILQKRDNDVSNSKNLEEMGLPFQDVAIEWFEANVRGRLSESSINNIKGDLNNHILKQFGLRGIKTIKNYEIQKFINEKSQEYSASLVKKLKQDLKSIFEFAIDNDYVTKNPAQNIKSTKCKEFNSDHKKMLNEDELALAFKAVEDDIFMTTMLAVFFIYGIRPCELIALKWKNINFKEDYIFIEKSKFTDSVKTTDKEKTRRYLTLTATIKVLLNRFYEHQKENNIDVGGLVFYRKTSFQPLESDDVDGYFKTLTREMEIANGAKLVNNKIVESTGVRHFSPYAFRKGVVTTFDKLNYNDALTEMFIGHTPKSVKNKYYSQMYYEKNLKSHFEKYLTIAEATLNSCFEKAGIDVK